MLDASPTKTVTFNLNGDDVTVPEGWTIWEAAKGQGFTIPHLCHKPATGLSPRRQLPRLYGRGGRRAHSGRLVYPPCG